MSLQIPDLPLGPDGLYALPSEYASELDAAQRLLSEQTSGEGEGDWQDAGVNAEVQLSRKDNPDDAYDVPWVRGVATVEGASPEEVLATVQLAGMRKKWDQRLDEAHPIRRYEPYTYLFYSVMKSPSYFIWARDVAGVQRNLYDSPSAGDITVLQRSVDAEDVLPDAGSYAKSRTRATVELGAWLLKKKGADTEVTYIVKIRLNGSIPTSVVSMVAAETPMCVGRVRDTLYATGFAPYEVHSASDKKTLTATMEFDDGDGTDATAGERRWTGYYRGAGADEFTLRYDARRMYPHGVHVEVAGDAKDAVSVELRDADAEVKVATTDAAKGRDFQVVITPKEA